MVHDEQEGNIQMQKERKISKLAYKGITILAVLAASYIMLVFPADFVLDIFWEKTGQDQIQAAEYNYGQFAGLPAGEGIPVLSSKGQFCDADSMEYYTFRTDMIIPLDAYRLKSGSDATDTAFRKGRRMVSGTRRWDMYSKKAGYKRFLFNRYYLTELPDGSYAAAYLDDACYLRYLIAGSVQLPIGRVEYMEAAEKQLLAEYIEEYDLDADKILVMFSQERYEQHKMLNYLVMAAVWVALVSAYVMLSVLVQCVLEKARKERDR